MEDDTLCGVPVVEQLGLTVGQDLDLWRIRALDAGRHESVQVLQTGHLRRKEGGSRTSRDTAASRSHGGRHMAE